METGSSLEHDEGWERVKKLIDLARSAHMTALTPERRQRIRQGLLERLERDRIERLERTRTRRLIARSFVAGASTMLLAGLVLRLVSGGGLPWIGQSSAQLERKPAAAHSVAE